MADQSKEQLLKKIAELEQMNYTLSNACDYDQASGKPVDKNLIIS